MPYEEKFPYTTSHTSLLPSCPKGVAPRYKYHSIYSREPLTDDFLTDRTNRHQPVRKVAIKNQPRHLQ